MAVQACDEQDCNGTCKMGCPKLVRTEAVPTSSSTQVQLKHSVQAKLQQPRCKGGVAALHRSPQLRLPSDWIANWQDAMQAMWPLAALAEAPKATSLEAIMADATLTA